MTDDADTDSPERTIGPLASLATVAGSMVGVGIFLVPPVVAERLPQTWAFYSVWIVAGLAALSGATAYAELGTLIPEAGGDYVFQREAFGPSVAFATGWVLFVGIFAGSVAALAVPLVEHQVATLAAAAAGRTGESAGPSLPGGPAPWAVGIIGLLTWLNSFRTRVSAGFQTATTVVPVVVLAAAGIWALTQPSPAAPSNGGNSPAMWAWADAYTATYFAFAGWNAVIYVAGEVRRPDRDLPRALLGGTTLVTVLYLVLCAAFLHVLGLDGLAAATEAGSATARQVAGDPTGLAVAAVIAVALLASLNATILGGARVAYAMARRGGLASYFGELNDAEVPERALWFQAAVAAVFAATGTFEQVLDLVGVAMMVLGTVTVASLYVLRTRRPDADRPYRATGYPWLPALYILSSLAVVATKVIRAISGEAVQWYPLVGVVLFGALWAGHRAYRTV